MTKVNAQVHGGRVVRDIAANTVSDVFAALNLSGNHTVMVNGEPATMSTKVSESDFVTFAQAVKGGC